MAEISSFIGTAIEGMSTVVWPVGRVAGEGLLGQHTGAIGNPKRDEMTIVMRSGSVAGIFAWGIMLQKN